jgi:hypothetical protein
MIKHETSSCKITQIFSIAYDQAWKFLLQDYTKLCLNASEISSS